MSNLNTNETTSNTEEAAVKTATVNDISLPKGHHIPFDDVSSVEYFNSVQIKSLVDDLFGSVYSDYYGSLVEVVPGTNIPTISLYFDHVNHGDDAINAVTCGNGTKSGLKTLKAQMGFVTNMLNNGEGYQITPDGIGGIGKFIADVPFAKNLQTKEIYWKKIVTETADTPAFGYNPQQVTKVSCLDITKIFNVLHETVSETGEKYFYHADVFSSMPGTGQTMAFANVRPVNNTYIFQISRITESNLVKLNNTYGLAPMSNIRRGN
mgnify:FL=1